MDTNDTKQTPMDSLIRSYHQIAKTIKTKQEKLAVLRDELICRARQRSNETTVRLGKPKQPGIKVIFTTKRAMDTKRVDALLRELLTEDEYERCYVERPVIIVRLDKGA